MDPLILATSVTLAWYVGTPMPDGGKRIDGLGAWALLATLGAWLVLWGGGSSPGKLLLGLRVVQRRSGGRPGILRMAGRELLGKAVGALLLGYGFFVAASEPDGRALHDRLFGTVVVARRRPISDANAPQARGRYTTPTML